MTFRPCIVVPVFNHGDGATALMDHFAPLGLAVYFVNDGSTDDTALKLAEIAGQYPEVRIVERPENGGKGAAVVAGLRAAHAEGFSHALQIDADGQHDARDIPGFLALAEAQPDAVIAGQPVFDDSIPAGRLVGRYLTHVWIWVETLSFTIKDSMCGFRVYPLAAVIRVTDRVRLGRRMDFDPEILVRLHWDGLRILPLPTRVIYPAGGTSHFRLWLDNWLITRMHTRLVFGMICRVMLLRAGRFGGRATRRNVAG
ncbi:MAG: glycosyltransferase involved in cell wall biosynthesis [Paracoccaceae bacterium]|jgi:glycosyltransferase involved in cell wall biosynthesis